MKIYHLLFALIISLSLSAQNEIDNRWTEEKVRLEHIFMDANIQIMVGKYDEALKILKKIYKEDTDNPGLNFQLAQVYGSLNDLPAAIKHGKKAVDAKPNNEFYNLLLSNLLIESNQVTEAIISMDKLVILQPDKTDYYDMLAKAHLRNGDYKKAIATFDKLESQLGFSEDLALRKVDILDENGKSKEVVGVLQKLVSTFPNEMRYRYNLATYYTKNGKEKEAKEVYRQILEIDNEDPTANLALLDDIDNPTDENSYLNALQPLIENEKILLDKKILEMIPYLERLGSEPELGQPLLKIGKTLVQLYPKEAKIRAMYADIFNGLGDTDNAIEQYEKTIALDDRVYTVWEQLIMAYNYQGNYTSMSTKAEQAMDLYPNKASAYYLYASANISLGKYDEAMNYLQDAQMIAGRDLYHKANVENQKARLAMAQKKYDEAEMHLSKSMEWSKGQDPQAIEFLGDLASMKGDNDQAIKYWTKAKEVGSANPHLSDKISKGTL